MTDFNRPALAGLVREQLISLAQWDRGHPGEDYPWEELGFPLEEATVMMVDSWLLETARMKRACDQLAKRLSAWLLADIEAQGPIRLGNVVYASTPDRNRKVTDPVGLAAWLGDHWARAIRIDAANVRITTVRQIAILRGEDPQAVEDTFFAWEGDEGQRRLQPYRVDGKETPKWAQQLADGERRAR